MFVFFFRNADKIYYIQSTNQFSEIDISKLSWILQADLIEETKLSGTFIGPRKEMITPWSTNATEICQNIGLSGILRIEEFTDIAKQANKTFDVMLENKYQNLDPTSLNVDQLPQDIQYISDIKQYNQTAGLALSAEEVLYLEHASKDLGRKLTDSEIFGFAQINSEHCRHKIFSGTFIIDGETKEKSLFDLIKETSKQSPKEIVSAYKDNVAFIQGPSILQFAPNKLNFFSLTPINTVLSLKAETHNFPTTVEPFNGASTGSGGEIRDRMAGGKASIPLIGTAVYMTSYPRLGENTPQNLKPRKWKYQSPDQILIKASNGASDFGNKFGQPLIVGSVLTFEGQLSYSSNTQPLLYAYDRTVMLAGGVGYANQRDAQKEAPQKGDRLILLGGDNYRIGMAGGSVSSVNTGALSSTLELSAVQRANPEMQKRVYNVIRTLAESSINPIILIHDHGAGGHMNCFAELFENAGGKVQIASLPIGDSTLSAREILSNESQERMGLIVSARDLSLISAIAQRERAPFYDVGEVTADGQLVFEDSSNRKPVNLPLKFFLGSSPKTILEDTSSTVIKEEIPCQINSADEFLSILEKVFSLEAVACKDWLTNKVDRSVTGRIALQQTTGPLQLPLNNLGVVALDYCGEKGIATALGHAPIPGLANPEAGSRLSLAEALTNLVWAPLKNGLDSVALSANWMWPAKQPQENSRLYSAVEALSKFAIELGLPIPTGKDSLSMTMNYNDGLSVRAPGTVIITAVAECSDITKCITPELKPILDSQLLYLNFSGLTDYPLGGSSYAQALGLVGTDVPTVTDAQVFKAAFNSLQSIINQGLVLSGHDISSGGLITTLCEMAFAGNCGIEINLQQDQIPLLLCEKPGVVIQVKNIHVNDTIKTFTDLNIPCEKIAKIGGEDILITAGQLQMSFSRIALLKTWFKPSYLLDRQQTHPDKALERFNNITKPKLNFNFSKTFSGQSKDYKIDIRRTTPSQLKAAIIREKGTNGDREMAFALYASGFEVKDLTMSDLMSGRESLDDIGFLVFPGGFSNSDVLGAAKGWAGAFRYNENARNALQSFYQRPKTLSLGVCNGCQLMVELDLIYPEHNAKVSMRRNESKKFESAFINLQVIQTNSILLKNLSGSSLGIWVAHGEGQFNLPHPENEYDIPLRYSSASYPDNPNGSEFNAAGIVSKDGRHLAMMPHLERSIFPWQWPYYLNYNKQQDQISPWIIAFCNARDWLASS